MKTFVVSDDCVSCGLCLQETDLLVEDAVGKAKPAEKCIINDLKKAEKIVADCPVGAISIVEKGDIKQLDEKTIRELPNLLGQKLRQVKRPQLTDEVKLDARKYNVKRNGESVGAYDYKYSSESNALSAAIDQFDRIAYSQYARFITEILVQYKEEKLKKYYIFDKNSFWNQENAKYRSVLLNFANEIESLTNGTIKLSDDFIKFEVYPCSESDIDNNYHMWGLKYLEQCKNIESIMSAFHGLNSTSKNDYKTYIDTDDIEVYAGTGWFGGDKYKTKYCYCLLSEAVETYLSDLTWAINYADADQRAIDGVKWAITSYNNKVDKTIEEKIIAVKNLFYKKKINEINTKNSNISVKIKEEIKKSKDIDRVKVARNSVKNTSIIRKHEYLIRQAKEYAKQGNNAEAKKMYDEAVSYVCRLELKIEKDEISQIYEYFIGQAKEYAMKENHFEAERMYDKAVSYANMLGLKIKKSKFNEIFNLENKKEYTEDRNFKKLNVNVNFMREYEYFIRQAKEYERQKNNAEVKRMYDKAVSYAKSLGIEIKKDEIRQIYECFIDRAKEIEREAKKMYDKTEQCLQDIANEKKVLEKAIHPLQIKKISIENKSFGKQYSHVDFTKEYEYFIRQAKEYERQGLYDCAKDEYDRAEEYAKAFGLSNKEDESLEKKYENCIKKAREYEEMAKDIYDRAEEYANSVGLDVNR